MAQAVTSGKHHFFGYYDKSPWDASGRYLLTLEVDFMDRQPTADDVAVIGMVDLQDGNRWIPLDETRAWCWQQGTMLQWLSDTQVIYNQRQGDQFVSVIRDVFTGETRTLSRPIYCISPDKKQALSLNFARLHRTRPGYGYAGVPDAWADDPHPAEDGIFCMDLETGEHDLIISLDQMRYFQPRDTMGYGQHWFNHLLFAPDSSRFVFLHRWKYDTSHSRDWLDRFVTAKPDGSDICIIADDDMISHFDYFSPDKIIAWAQQDGIGNRYFMFKGCTRDYEIIGENSLTSDGHCSFSPDRKWMLTDTYANAENRRTLILYHLLARKRYDIGSFYSPPELSGPIRCDLHPRWNHDGTQVCIDSVHEGSRQVYVLDVSEVVS